MGGSLSPYAAHGLYLLNSVSILRNMFNTTMSCFLHLTVDCSYRKGYNLLDFQVSCFNKNKTKV